MSTNRRQATGRSGMITSGYYNQVYRDILAGKATLPSLPDVALRIRQAMGDDDHDFETIARIVQTDVGITASLIRMANSPLYYRRQPALDVKTAISRLGLAGTRDYVTICAMRALFDARTRAVRVMMRELWEQATELAALAAVLASLSRCFTPDRAMLAGLIQDIGALPLLTRIDRSAGTDLDVDAVRDVLGTFGPKIGAVLLAHWDFDDDLVRVARARDPEHRDDKDHTGSLAEFVQLARIHMESRLSAAPAPRDDQVDALTRLNLGEVTSQGKLRMLIEAKTEVIRVRQMLGA